jgi:hypothetical protein
MIVKGWKNWSYGIRITQEDRDEYFQREWPSVTIEFEGGGVTEAELTKSFWKDQKGCIELRSADIGRWLHAHGLAPWPKYQPPELKLESVGPRRFRLSKG